MTRPARVIYQLQSETTSDGGENVSRDEALRLLGVKRQTLYTYVSRGWIKSFRLSEGRARVFSLADIERVRARSLIKSGIGAVAETVMRYGEPIITTRITEIIADGPRYRGRLAVDLAGQGIPFEAVALALWTGVWRDGPLNWSDVPDFQPTVFLKTDTGKGSYDFVKSFPSAVLALGMQAPNAEQSGAAETLVAARGIIQVLAGMLGLLSSRQRYTPACPGEPLANAIGRILEMRPDPERYAALNAMMVLCADYELTPASFAARVVASSGGDLYASVSAGLCAHSGQLTGQICDKLADLMSGGSQGANLEARLKEVRKSGATLYGFNPALAIKGDARAYWMIERAKALESKSPSSVTRNILRFLERLSQDFGLYPGLPAGLVTLTAALGLPPKSAAAIWGVARTAGQIAHVIEQRDAGFLLRPRALFVSS